MSSIYRRNGIWWYKRYLTPGKKVDKSLKTRDEKIARLLQHKYDSQIDHGALHANAGRETKEFVREYLSYALEHKQPLTAQRDQENLELFFRWACVTDLKQVSPEMLNEFIRTRRQRASKATVNRNMNTLRAALRYAAGQGYLVRNPAEGIRAFQIDYGPGRFLTDSEIEKALEAAGSWLPLLALGIFAGLRLGEALHLEWEDIDFEGRKIKISVKPGFRPKTGRTRIIPLSERLRGALEPVRKKSGLLFPVKGGRAWRTYPKKELARIFRAAGLKGIGWKTLRRTFGSQLAQAGVSLVKIAKWLGDSYATTMRHYAHLLPEYDEEIEKIGRRSATKQPQTKSSFKNDEL